MNATSLSGFFRSNCKVLSRRPADQRWRPLRTAIVDTEIRRPLVLERRAPGSIVLDRKAAGPILIEVRLWVGHRKRFSIAFDRDTGNFVPVNDALGTRPCWLAEDRTDLVVSIRGLQYRIRSFDDWRLGAPNPRVIPLEKEATVISIRGRAIRTRYSFQGNRAVRTKTLLRRGGKIRAGDIVHLDGYARLRCHDQNGKLIELGQHEIVEFGVSVWRGLASEIVRSGWPESH
jgi:hypothetical protein